MSNKGKFIIFFVSINKLVCIFLVNERTFSRALSQLTERNSADLRELSESEKALMKRKTFVAEKKTYMCMSVEHKFYT